MGKLLYWLLSGGRIFDREYHRQDKYNLATSDADMVIHIAYMILDNCLIEDPAKRLTADQLTKEIQNLIWMAERGARLLRTDVPQRCIFCAIGLYKVQGRAPHIIYSEDIEQYRNYIEANKFGLDFSKELETRYGIRADVFFLVCDYCGNVQQFRLDRDFGKAHEHWRRLPQNLHEAPRPEPNRISSSDSSPFNPSKRRMGD